MLIFFTTFLLSSPVIYLGYSDTNNVIKNEACNLYNNRYKLFGSIFCFLIPLTIMIVMYYYTVKRLKEFRRAFENFKEKSTKHTMKRSTFKANSFLVQNKRITCYHAVFTVTEPSTFPLNLSPTHCLAVKTCLTLKP